MMPQVIGFVAVVAEVLSGILIPPPPAARLVDFARTCFVPEGTDPGLFCPHPAQEFVLEDLDAALHGEIPQRQFVVIKPTQDGGTLITSIIPSLYVTAQLGDPWISAYPDMRLAGVAWRQKLRRMILKSGWEEWLPEEGPGSDGGGNPTEVALRGTPHYYVGGGASNEAGQAMLTGRCLSRDERDSMDPYVAQLMAGRVDEYKDAAIIIDTSTIKADVGSQTKDRYDISDKGHLQWQCPHCRGFHAWDWDRDVRVDKHGGAAAAEAAHLVCPLCEQVVTDAMRCRLQRDRRTCRRVFEGQTVTKEGVVVGDPPDTLVRGMLWQALDSPRITLAFLAKQFIEAHALYRQGDPSALRRFYRDRCCKQWIDTQRPTVLTAAHLERVSEASVYSAGEVTEPGLVLVGTVDVQLRWQYWWVEAFGPGDQTWVIAAGIEEVTSLQRDEHGEFARLGPEVEPNRAEHGAASDRIEAIMNNGFRLQSDPDTVVPVLLRGMDVGFRQRDRRWWLAQHPHWNAVKGDSDPDADQRGAQGTLVRDGRRAWYRVLRQKDEHGEWDMYLVNTAPVKAVVQSSYLIGAGAGKAHLPRGLRSSSAICRHLVAEREVAPGKWEKITHGAANHYLDDTVYAHVLYQAYREAHPPEPPPAADPRSHLPSAPPRAADAPGRGVTRNRRHSRLGRRGW